MQEKSTHYTLLLIPSASGKVRRVRIARIWGTVAVGCGIVAVFALLYFVGNYIIARERLEDLQQLQRLARLQQERISTLATKVEEFSQTIDELRELERRLETMTGGGGANPGAVPLKEGMSTENLTSHSTFGTVDPVSVATNPLAALSVLEREVSLLVEEAALREQNLVSIEQAIAAQKDRFDCTPNIYPVKGWVSTGYEWRRNPFTGRREMHEAIDIVSAWGTPIKAACKGTITHAGWKQFYGLCVEIVNEYGYRTMYAHLSKVLVETGQEVEKGEVVGRLGSSGRSTGPHLHFEVWQEDRTINPFDLMVEPLGKPH